MRPTEKIEKFLQKASVSSNHQVNKAVLNELTEEMEKTKYAGTSLNMWRIIMKSRMFKFAAAAVIVITGLVCIKFIGSTNAYAQVVQELRNARTVVFTLITQTNQGNGETVKTDIAYKDPGHLRTTTVDGYVCVVDFTSGKMISIVPTLQIYTLAEIKNLANIGAKGPFDSIEAMKNLPAKADENLGTKEIDGIACDGYKVAQGDLTTTVWLVTDTGDLVQVEQKYASAPGMNRIIKNVKFDVVLDDSLFSLTPPAGYKSSGVELKSDASAETEETFVAWLQWWANGNVDETFPPMVAGSEIAKVTMDMAREGKLKGSAWEKVNPGQMFNALLFVAHLPKESNWRYAGNGVKLGTPDKAIFWYKPAGSEKYHVIYGDLSVKEMNEADLPK